jgi:putative transposase
MPRMYPASVRRQIVARLRSGEPVAAVALDTGVCQATLFRWKRQALIDAGVVEGVPSVEADELAAARKRIAALEAELVLTRDACELFDEQAVVPPKRRRAIAEGLIARGYSARSACRITGLARSLLQYHRRRPVPDREIRRLIVADTITEIHQRSRCTYGRRRVRAALLADYEMNVNLKLVNSIMSERGLYGLPRPGRRIPNLIRVATPEDLVNRHFTATRPNELWCTEIKCRRRHFRSATHSRLGAGGPNCRCTRSAGRGAVGSGIVVRLALPRVAPLRPSSAISRSTVQRATVMPSRLSANHTLRAPYTP